MDTSKPANKASLPAPIEGSADSPEKEIDLKTLARAATQKAFDTLTNILDNAKAADSNKIRAAEVILDRGWGKPKQEIESNHVVSYQDFLKQVAIREQRYQACINKEDEASAIDVTPLVEQKPLTFEDLL